MQNHSRTIRNLRLFRRVLWMAVPVTVLSTLGAYLWMDGHRLLTSTESTGTLISGKFSLVNHDGRAVRDTDYKGKWRLMFFGFTHCPDVCPTTLNTMATIMRQLGDDAKYVVPLFVSIDPERDRPAILKEYALAFDDRIIGLTGSVEQITATARNFRVYYKKSVGKEKSEDYLMDHSTAVYLMDADGRFATMFSHRTKIEKIVIEIRKRLEK